MSFQVQLYSEIQTDQLFVLFPSGTFQTKFEQFVWGFDLKLGISGLLVKVEQRLVFCLEGRDCDLSLRLLTLTLGF